MTASDDAILRATQRLEEVEALSGIGSWDWEIAADRLHWSDQPRRIYEMERVRRELGYDDFIGRVHRDDRDAVQAIVQQAFEQGGTFETDHRILSAAKRAVEAHGGTIDVETTEGEGATFMIRLPPAG